MPRTTTQMPYLSPALTDAPGSSSQVREVQGLRSDGTFERDDANAEWYAEQSLRDAAQDVKDMLAHSRKKLGVSPSAKHNALPFGARVAASLAQKPAERAYAAIAHKQDAFENTAMGMAAHAEKQAARRTTTSLPESLDEPAVGLFKRLFRREGGQHGGRKK